MQAPAITKVSADLIESLDLAGFLHLLGRRNVGPGGAYGLQIGAQEVAKRIAPGSDSLPVKLIDLAEPERESIPACVTGSRKKLPALAKRVEESLAEREPQFADALKVSEAGARAVLIEAGLPAILHEGRLPAALDEARDSLEAGGALALVAALWRQRPSEHVLQSAVPVVLGSQPDPAQVDALLASAERFSVPSYWDELERRGFSQIRVQIGASRYVRRNQWIAEDGAHAATAMLNALDHPSARARFLALYDHFAEWERFYGFALISGVKA